MRSHDWRTEYSLFTSALKVGAMVKYFLNIQAQWQHCLIYAVVDNLGWRTCVTFLNSTVLILSHVDAVISRSKLDFHIFQPVCTSSSWTIYMFYFIEEEYLWSKIILCNSCWSPPASMPWTETDWIYVDELISCWFLALIFISYYFLIQISNSMSESLRKLNNLAYQLQECKLLYTSSESWVG